MKLKTLGILIVLAVLLGGWAAWTLQKKSAGRPSAVGARVLPPFPINDVSKIHILSPGTNITLAKTQGIWTVVSRFHYPANFDKIADAIQELSELKIGHVIPVTESQLGQFALLPPATNAAPELTGKTGTLLQLFNDKNKMLAFLLIGKHFMHQPPAGQAANPMMGLGGYPAGQYVRTGEGKVFLVANTLDRLTENAKTWLDDEFINVPAQDIMEMTVSGPERKPICLRRATADAPLTLEGVGPDEGVADPSALNALSSGLNYLGFDDVAAPILTTENTGLDQAVVVQARTRQGQLYTVKLGNTLTNDSFDRYMQVSVAYEAPPAEAPNADVTPDAQKPKADDAKTLAERTQTLNSKVSPWIYVLKSYRAEPLLTQREAMVKKPEPQKNDAATGTNTPTAETQKPTDKPKSLN